jgi:ribosomal protein L11 methyltransferase
MQTYLELKLSQVPANLEDEISGLCFENGASGVAEEMAFTQMREDYAPEKVETEFISLVAYFEQAPREEFLNMFQQKYPEVVVELKEQENKDWLEEWKKDFVAFPLAGDYWVVPSWLEAPSEAKKYLSIDPGMAFGTGTHETTQLASEFLEERKSTSFAQVKSVLDVGTGTGILAMLCRLEFAQKVVTTEIDADARVVARENFAKNSCSDIELPDYQIENLEGSFDLVIANIIDGVLTKLKQDLIRCTKDSGYLILTGILEERDKAFISGFLEGEKLEVVHRGQKGEWIGYILRKTS